MQLFRDSALIDTQTLGLDNNWSYTWNSLPVRKNDGSGLSVYSVQEAGTANGVYTTSEGIAYDVSVTGGGSLQKTGDVYSASAEVTNTHTPLLLDLSAQKDWGDDQQKINVRPTAANSVKFKLQYRISGDTEWQDFPQENILGNQAASVLLQKDASQVYMLSNHQKEQSVAAPDWSTEWTGLTAYVRVNGETKAVEYRAVETASPVNYTTENGGVSAAVTYESTSKNVTITNNLKLGSIVVSKQFTGNAEPLDQAAVNRLFEQGLLPQELLVTLSYSDGAQRKTETGTLTYDPDGQTYGTCTFMDLPVAKADGTPVVYTVEDSAEGYAFIQCGSATVQIDQASRSANSVVTNEIKVGSITVTKNWQDEDNRDNGRQPITVTLFRGDTPVDSQELNAVGGWSYTWNDLPVYGNTRVNGVLQKPVYTVKEAGETEGVYMGLNGRQYTVHYSDGVQLTEGTEKTLEITNTHSVIRFALNAQKRWNDGNTYSAQRPDVQLELRWALEPDAQESQWLPVSAATTPASGYAVTTSSQIVQTLRGPSAEDPADLWTGAHWNDLPAYVTVPENGADVSRKVYYKVFEAEDAEGYTSVPSLAVSIDDVQEREDGTADVAVEVVNTLSDTTFLTVTKQWAGVNEELVARPDAVVMKLQYAETAEPAEADWADMPGSEKLLTAEGTIPWTAVWQNLRADRLYRAVEVSLRYGENVVPAAPLSGNAAAGQIGSYRYASVVSEDDTGMLTRCTITNTLVAGKLEVVKSWQDGSNRDNMRPESVTFVLFRDDSEEAIEEKTVAVTPDGIESCVFENLPVYRDATGARFRYYVVEKSVDGYTPVYSFRAESGVELRNAMTTSVTVTNVHEPTVFAVEAVKEWKDGMDPYGLRPNSVKLKLQYALSPDAGVWKDVASGRVPEAGTDDGTQVFTTSPLIQELKSTDAAVGDGSFWGTARWENLPANVLSGTEATGFVTKRVYYRVVEVGTPSSAYAATAGTAVTCGGRQVVSTTVTNELVHTVTAEVEKAWKDNAAGELKNNMPSSVTVQLQYRERVYSAWKNVPQGGEAALTAGNNWSAAFRNLPGDYEYRIVETGITVGSRTYTADKNTVDTGHYVASKIHNFNSTGMTTEQENSGKTVFLTKLVNELRPKYSLPKTGDDAQLLLAGSVLGVSFLGLLGAAAVRKRKKDED